MSPRFLCTGDLHLGAGADLGREPGERLAEQEAVLDLIVQIANELEAMLVFAGDAWERRRPTPAELLAWFRPLDKARLSPLVIPGNHDVEAFDRPTGYDVRVKAEHVARPDITVADGTVFCCLPWAPPGHLVALDGGGDRDDLNDRLAQGLVEIARGLHAKAVDLAAETGKPLATVLLAHWSIGGATTPTGAPVDLFREPVLPLEELDRIGFDAIVAGHIHKPQWLGDSGFYVGSPMPLNFGEATSEHCVWLLDVEPGRMQAFQIPIESRRLVTLTVRNPRDAISGLDDVDGAVVKVKIHATQEEARRLDVAGYKRQLEDAGAHKVYSVTVDVDRPEVAAGEILDETIDDVEAFDRWLQVSGIPFDTDVWGDLHDTHVEYLAKAGVS